MYIGLFIYAGWLIRFVADAFDKTKPKIEWGQQLVFLMIASFAFAIQAVLGLHDNFKSEFAVAAYFILEGAIGYAPGHFWDKINTFFQKKAEEKLG